MPLAVLGHVLTIWLVCFPASLSQHPFHRLASDCIGLLHVESDRGNASCKLPGSGWVWCQKALWAVECISYSVFSRNAENKPPFFGSPIWHACYFVLVGLAFSPSWKIPSLAVLKYLFRAKHFQRAWENFECSYGVHAWVLFFCFPRTGICKCGLVKNKKHPFTIL